MLAAAVSVWLLTAAIGQPALARDCLSANGVPLGALARIYYSPDDKTPAQDVHCHAIILNQTWLLSPASCLFDYNHPNKYKVKVQLDEPFFKAGIVVQNIIRNPTFNNELGAGYDLALINVLNKLPLPAKCQVLIPSKELAFIEKDCKLVKWSQLTGGIESELPPPESGTITMYKQPASHCKFTQQVSDLKLVECAGRSAKKTVCANEAGALVLCPSVRQSSQYYVRDMSSWGDAFCEQNENYLFTRVAQYSDWIMPIISNPVAHVS